ncbi:MAG: hypothetical protein G01um101429_583 [Parcubacteria group bacterium Gr01-1014_29]|nr:MAG: hypothetical protein G01um101429_583 [Parcubacteria group bacterium Gr01-1014_29]
MKQKDTLRVSTLRMLISAIRNKEISLIKKDTGLSEEETVQVIRTEVKQRKEAAAEFEKGGREELAEKELSEAVLLEAYLPAELSDDELQKAVKSAIREANASSEKDFGKIMKLVMMSVQGRVSGERVMRAVKNALHPV